MPTPTSNLILQIASTRNDMIQANSFIFVFIFMCRAVDICKIKFESLLRYRLSRDNITTVWFCFQRFHPTFYNSLCFLNIKQPFANDHAVRKLKIICALVSLFATINKTRRISTLQQALKLKQRTKCVQR